MKKLLLSLAAIALGFAANANELKQEFATGLGFPEGTQATVPTTPTTVTAADTGISYTLFGTNVNTGNYLMMAGKVQAGAYISWSLDFSCKQLQITTTSGGSTNEANAVKITANDNVIEASLAVNTQKHTYTVDIPAEYQAAGTVYKVESLTDKYNTQIASFTYVTDEEVDGPVVPTVPEYTVAEALAALNDGFQGKARVSGVITSLKEFGGDYGNYSYYIGDTADAAKDATLYVYRGYYLDGAKFTSADQIKVGDKVTVEGSIELYMGNTPEFTTGSKIISINGQGTPSNPTTEAFYSNTFAGTEGNTLEGWTITNIENQKPMPEGEGLSNDVWYINASQACLVASAYDNGTQKDYAVNATVSKEFDLTGKNNVNLSVEQAFGFDYPKTQEAAPYAKLYVESAGVKEYKNFANYADRRTNANGSLSNWTDFAENVFDLSEYDGSVITIGFEYVNDGSKSVTWELKNFLLYEKNNNAVTGIATDENAPAVYYNLQGVRVAQPEKGIYIKVKGGKSSKVVF